MMAVQNIQAFCAKLTFVDYLGWLPRIIDAVFCLMFIGIAVYGGEWIWWLCAVVSAVTAITNPVERLVKLTIRKMFFKQRR